MFESENAQQLVDALLRLRGDPVRYAQLRDNCLKAAPRYDFGFVLGTPSPPCWPSRSAADVADAGADRTDVSGFRGKTVLIVSPTIVHIGSIVRGTQS